MHLEIPPIEFKPVGVLIGADPGALLHASVAILGVDHALHAISVVRGRSGRQRPEAREATRNFHLVRAAACSLTAPFRTVRIGDRDYVLVLAPTSEQPPTPGARRPAVLPPSTPPKRRTHV